jgi:hypothetical protein
VPRAGLKPSHLRGSTVIRAFSGGGHCAGVVQRQSFLFADRGEFVAKGFEEPVRVYEVSWRH